MKTRTPVDVELPHDSAQTVEVDAAPRADGRVADELCQRGSSLLNRAERERLVNEVLDETFGLGPLEPLMKDPTITDILINGPKVAYVERKGRLERVDIGFHDDRHLVQIIQR